MLSENEKKLVEKILSVPEGMGMEFVPPQATMLRGIVQRLVADLDRLVAENERLLKAKSQQQIWQRQKIEQGLCGTCGKQPLSTKHECRSCRDKKNKARADKVRAEVRQ